MEIIRTCIISREKLNQKDLIQIYIDFSGEININKSGISGKKGRSVYLKNDKKNIEQFLKRPINFFKNFIKKDVKKENFDKIKNYLEKEYL